YIDSLLCPPPPAEEKALNRFVLKDVGVFLNSLQHSVDVMRQGGVDVGVRRQQTEREMVVTIRIRRDGGK
ncbi:MAG: nucleoid occlusion protein, partial [Oscillospiraceae bacterium]|nr:nucleoid occlusion protein [Oscillospiraceae bacterium]